MRAMILVVLVMCLFLFAVTGIPANAEFPFDDNNVELWERMKKDQLSPVPHPTELRKKLVPNVRPVPATAPAHAANPGTI